MISFSFNFHSGTQVKAHTLVVDRISVLLSLDKANILGLLS